METVFSYFKSHLDTLKNINPIYASIDIKESKGIEKLAKSWMKEPPPKSQINIHN